MNENKINTEDLHPIDRLRLKYRQGKLAKKGRDYTMKQRPIIKENFSMEEIIRKSDKLSEHSKND